MLWRFFFACLVVFIEIGACLPLQGPADQSSMCCECIKGVDSGSDLFSFEVGNASSCTACCEAAGSEYHSAKSWASATCTAHPHATASCTAVGTDCTIAADPARCCNEQFDPISKCWASKGCRW